MNEGPLDVDVSGSIATLTLNRPAQGNAIDLALARALFDAAVRCDADAAIRCVVLTGTGRMFCAGGDLLLLGAAGDRVPAVLDELAGTLHMAVARLAHMRKPLLALVNGPAAGAGVSLALLGDVVLMAGSAHFTAAYTAIGLTPDGGMSWLLPRLVGLRKAQEFILTNRRVLAPEAQAIGMVTRVVEDGALMAEGATIAQGLSHAATAALGAARALLLGTFAASIETQLELEARTIVASGAHADSVEGIAAFLAKRKPIFTGV